MGWTDYINPFNQEHGLGGALNSLGLNGPSKGTKEQVGLMNQVGGNVGQLADNAHVNYQQLSDRLYGSLNDLQAQAQGKNSISALQLQQAQRANLAQQRSMAAGAAPGNAAMAARQAANNMARLGYGLSGQQAIAGLAERNQAQQAYANMLGQARGQDLQGALGAYGTQVQAYGGGANAQANAPTLGGSILGGIEGLAGLGVLGGKKK